MRALAFLVLLSGCSAEPVDNQATTELGDDMPAEPSPANSPPPQREALSEAVEQEQRDARQREIESRIQALEFDRRN